MVHIGGALRLSRGLMRSTLPNSEVGRQMVPISQMKELRCPLPLILLWAITKHLTAAKGQCPALRFHDPSAVLDTAGPSLCLEALSTWLWHLPPLHLFSPHWPFLLSLPLRPLFIHGFKPLILFHIALPFRLVSCFKISP